VLGEWVGWKCQRALSGGYFVYFSLPIYVWFSRTVSVIPLLLLVWQEWASVEIPLNLRLTFIMVSYLSMVNITWKWYYKLKKHCSRNSLVEADKYNVKRSVAAEHLPLRDILYAQFWISLCCCFFMISASIDILAPLWIFYSTIIVLIKPMAPEKIL